MTNLIHVDYYGFFHGLIMGGCKVCRPTAKSILAAGPFSEINIAQPEGEPPYMVFPRIIGVLTK